MNKTILPNNPHLILIFEPSINDPSYPLAHDLFIDVFIPGRLRIDTKPNIDKIKLYCPNISCDRTLASVIDRSSEKIITDKLCINRYRKFLENLPKFI